MMSEASVCYSQRNVPLDEKRAVIIVVLLPTAAGMKSLQLILIYLTKYSYYRIDIIDYYFINIF